LRPPRQGPPKPRPSPSNKVSEDERRQIREVLHDARFVDQTPREIVPTLADEGVYLASIRTFYRVLRGDGELCERRLQARHPKREAPVLEALGPNEVWSWDITRVKGPYKGKFYYLYAMVDIFSRYTVGWMLAERESARKAQHFIRETARRR
jgi:putative transposase